MAAVLVRLKLRLLVNGLRSSSMRAQFFVLSAVTAALFAVGGFLVFAAGPPRLAGFAFPLFAAAWAVFPLVMFGVDETLDPARLAVLPLRRRPLMTGMLLAGAAGPWPLAFLVALLGCVPGYARSPAATPVAVAAVVVTFLFCLGLSRAVATSMARLLRSRRGRDLGVFVGTALSGVIVLAANTLQPRTTFNAPPGEAVLRWTPPGLTGHALFALRRGRIADAVADVALAAAMSLVVFAWWALVLGSAQVPADASTGGRARRARFGGRTPLGAVVARELRYVLREPTRRAQLPSLIVPASMFAIAAERTGPIYPVCAIGVLSGLALASNQVGEDGSAYWLHVLTGETGLLGKNLVRGGIAALFTAAAAVAIGFAGGHWDEIPTALLTAYGALGIALGAATAISVRAPFPPPPSGNPFASDPGRGCASGAYVSGAMAVCALAMAPAVLLAEFGPPLTGPAYALVVGGLGWVAGVRYAQQVAGRVQPEILAVLVRNAR